MPTHKVTILKALSKVVHDIDPTTVSVDTASAGDRDVIVECGYELFL